MRLERLCFEPRGGFFVAVTDAGVFKVPNVHGGWSRREQWPYSVACSSPGGDVRAIAQHLGMVSPQRTTLGGCGCIARRG